MQQERMPIYMQSNMDDLRRNYPRFVWDDVELKFSGAVCEVEVKDKASGRTIPITVIHGRNRYY